MHKKISFLFIFLGLATLPLLSKDILFSISITTLLFSIGLFFFGVNLFFSSSKLSDGSKTLLFIYKVSPVFLPILPIIIAFLFR